MFNKICMMCAVFTLGLIITQHSYGAVLRDSCTELGYTTGAACTGDAAWNLVSSCTQINETRPCIIISCPSSCVCGYSQSEACGGGGGGEIICPDCPFADIKWSNVFGQNYEQRISSYRQNMFTCECTPLYEYRCRAGFYSTTLSAIGGNPPDCAQCPTIPYDPSGLSLIFGSSDAGSNMITDCYIPKTDAYKDSTGTFQFSQDCHYSE